MSGLAVQFAFGAALLLLCAKLFVHLAEKISRSFRISPLLIGATLVALGTSLPELSVSTLAAAAGDIGLATGNLVGSNIVNILLIAGVGILIGKLRIGTQKTQQEAMLLLAVTILFALLHLTGVDHVLAGVLLVSMAGVVTMYQFYLAKRGSRADVRMFNHKKRPRLTASDAILLLVAIGGISWGATITVGAIENIALLTGYSTTLLGLTIAALTTSLPELVTTVVSEEEHEEKLTVGNLLGSNTYNILLIGGIVSLFGSDSVVAPLDWMMLVISTIIFVVLLNRFSGRVIPRGYALLLFGLLAAYLLTRVYLTPGSP